ncbi:transaldolase [Nocardia africana]|uniref:Transaldolase n=1 Tax=Nocardia africana TaxID=134964 RepID=A0ABW6NXC9_9NOCA
MNRLTDQGVSVWLDDLSREAIVSEELSRLVEVGINGVTSNLAAFGNALKNPALYAVELQRFAKLGGSAVDVARAMLCADARAACELFSSVYESSEGREGYVAIDVDPACAHDANRTIAEAEMLCWLVDRPNLMIAIPATQNGLAAIRACLARGINVNATLIFSLDRYRRVVGSFFDGLEAAGRAGKDVSRIASTASFPVSAIDTAVDGLIDTIDTEYLRPLRGHAALARAISVYEEYERSLYSGRWLKLASLGAAPQRIVWTSTNVDDPAYDATRYVQALPAPGTISTVSAQTLYALHEHGEIREIPSVAGQYSHARTVFARLATERVDFAHVTARLEHEALTKSQQAWQALIEDIAQNLIRYPIEQRRA